MYAYELLPKLTYLILTGQDEEGNLEFYGHTLDWIRASKMEEEMSNPK